MLLEHFDGIHNCPSYIYHCALPFSPSSSWLYECYIAELSQGVRVVEGLQGEWGMCSRTVLFKDHPRALSYWNNTIAVGFDHGDILILNGITGSQTAILSGHTNSVRSLTFSLDGTSLVSGSHDNTVKLWDMQTGGVVKTFSGHTSTVWSVSNSVNHTTIASGSNDKTIRLWDIQTGQCHQIIEQQKMVYCVMFSPKNPQTFFVSSSGVQQWNIDGHKVGPKHGVSYTCVAFSPDGTQFISYKYNGVMVHNTVSGVVVATLNIGASSGKSCCFSPDGRLVAVSSGHNICVWDITGSGPHLVETFVGHTNDITSLMFSSPSTLISGSYNESVKFWQIGTSSTDPVVTDPKSIPSVTTPTRSIALSAKDSIIIPNKLDGVMKAWGISTSLCKGSPKTLAEDPHQSNAQPTDSKLICVWYADGKINIWDAEKGQLIQTISTPRGDVRDLRVSGDGSKVFCLSKTFILAWDIQTGETVDNIKNVKDLSHVHKILLIDGSKLWTQSTLYETQRWDFGILGSSSVEQSGGLPDCFHLSDTKLWEFNTSRIKDIVTGKVVLQLPQIFGRAICVQWDGRYLVASFRSKEVLIIDFSHIILL